MALNDARRLIHRDADEERVVVTTTRTDGAGSSLEARLEEVGLGGDVAAALQGTEGTPSDVNRFVTDEDPRLAAEGLDPDTLAALVGTDGTPSAANPFVTDSDPRLDTTVLDQDTLDALQGTDGVPSDLNRFVTNSDSRLGGGTGLQGIVSAMVSGAAGDGVTNDRTALHTLANTTLQPDGGTIYFEPGTYLVQSDMTFPNDVFLWFSKGAKLKPDAGVVITIRGGISAGLHQIFDTSTTGVIRFSTSGDLGVNTNSAAVTEVYPEWWGAIPDGSTDCTVGLRRWMDALTGFPSNGLGTPRWADAMGRLSSGVYKVTGQVKAVCLVGARIEGAGYENTVIRFHGGESNTASSGGATTLTRSGAGWATNVWANGTDEYHVYIHTGTGAGQWRKIASNTSDTLTVSAAWATNPDATSQYHIAIKSVLDLNGFFDGQLSHFSVEVFTSTPVARARFGILYYRNPATSARGSSRGKFYAIKVGGPTVQSAFQLGDISEASIWQEDLCTLIGCQAQGSTTRTQGLYQNGFTFGTGAFANPLNFTAMGCESLSYSSGITVNCTNLIWTGGTTQGNDQDYNILGGAQGYVEFRGNRSEGSKRLYTAFTGNSVGMVVVLATQAFRGEDFQNHPTSLQPDLIYHDAGGALIIDGLFVNSMKEFNHTATSATSTTITNTGAAYPTTNGGMAGWDIQITGGTGAGQRRTITSNTATVITVPAFTTTPDSTSTYRVAARARISGGANRANSIRCRNIQFENTPIANAVFCGSASIVTLEDYHELNEGSEGEHYPTAGPVIFHGATTAQNIASYAFAKIGSTPDAALFRTSAGSVGSGRFDAGVLVARAAGTTPASAQVTKIGSHSGGATTHTYFLVGKVSDGAGGFKRAMPSSGVSETNCLAALNEANKVRISSPSGDRAPFTHYDILKSSTSFSIAVSVPWHDFPYLDRGQASAAYTPPVADETGMFAHQGALAGFYGTAPVAKPVVTGATGAQASVVSAIEALADLGLVTDSTTVTAARYGDFDAGNSGTAIGLSAINGEFQKLTMTGNCTITPTMEDGEVMVVDLYTGAGSFTATFDGVVFGPAGFTLTATASRRDRVALSKAHGIITGVVVDQGFTS